MSLIDLQTAIASLIRLPHSSQNQNLDKLITNFDLTEKEQETLRQLGQDPLVMKFGYSINHHRRGLVSKAMLISKFYLKSEDLDALWAHQFEPHARFISRENYEIGFFDYLLTHPESADLRSKMPDFLIDILCVEKIQMRFQKQWLSWTKKWEGASPFRHSGFEFHHARYSIAELFGIFAKTQASLFEPPVPLKKESFYLFIQTTKAPQASIFEIDPTSFFILKEAKQNAQLGIEGVDPRIIDLLASQGLLPPGADN